MSGCGVAQSASLVVAARHACVLPRARAPASIYVIPEHLSTPPHRDLLEI